MVYLFGYTAFIKGKEPNAAKALSNGMAIILDDK